MHRTLDAALARSSGPSVEDVAAQIAHRLTCDRCRMGWSCGGLSEDDYTAGARIADLLAAHTAAAEGGA